MENETKNDYAIKMFRMQGTAGNTYKFEMNKYVYIHKILNNIDESMN